MFQINTDFRRIQPYSITMLSAFLLGIGLLYLLNRRDGVPKRIAGYLALLNPVMIVCNASGLTYLSSHGRSLGFSSLGSLFGMYGSEIVMSLICGKRDAARTMLENCTLVLPLMYGVSKFGCFLAGCCRGFAYAGTFCVTYTGAKTGTVSAFPVQLLESLSFLLLFGIGMLLRKRHRSAAVFVIFFLSAAAKGMLDFLRAEHQGKLLSLNQILCGVLIVLGAAVLVLRVQQKTGKNRIKKRAAS